MSDSRADMVSIVSALPLSITVEMTIPSSFLSSTLLCSPNALNNFSMYSLLVGNGWFSFTDLHRTSSSTAGTLHITLLVYCPMLVSFTVLALNVGLIAIAETSNDRWFSTSTSFLSIASSFDCICVVSAHLALCSLPSRS